MLPCRSVPFPETELWSHKLQVALMEGLPKYPHHRRNILISEYIFEQTGTWRTPNQVASYIQRLTPRSAGANDLSSLSSDSSGDSIEIGCNWVATGDVGHPDDV
ncbi:hypothetical protein B0H10DRAFT_2090326 [Mycena sp. CBHHK59/15]|nr:hypothetical protein B0H10DRAFT_2090326 [Mycena sp. CBHHK59/15]